MPKFELNKLVRDKLPDEYVNSNQKAVYRVLTLHDHKLELKRKIIEETQEIRINQPASEIVSELADVRQAIDDLMSLYGINEEQLKATQHRKFDKKGGFADGNFVETLELSDNDEWVNYYREQPDIFPEVPTNN